MRFEIHITSLDEELEAWCLRRGFKFTPIRNLDGVQQIQPLMTTMFHGTQEQVGKYGAFLMTLVPYPVRLKIETKHGVPCNYTEHHYKIKLPAQELRSKLMKLGVMFGMSYNERKTQEIFVTTRGDRFVQGLEFVLEDYTVIEHEHESVIVDSNHDLDKGWLFNAS